MKRPLPYLIVLAALACSRKKDPQPSVTKTVESAKPLPSVEAKNDVPETSVPVDAAPIDDALEAELTGRFELAIPEGKVLPLPKLKPATPETVKAHAAALQTIFEAQFKEGCKEIRRFNASWVPATYIQCLVPGKQGARLTENIPDLTRLIEVEGTATNVVELAARNGPNNDHGSDAVFELWNSPRGYFIDVAGDGTYMYILRREIFAGQEPKTECKGKAWNPETGDVHDAEPPHFPTRGKDVDGDGRNEFPDAGFSHRFEGFSFSTAPSPETSCNVVNDARVTLDVMFLDDEIGSYRAFYEKRLAGARARASRIRKWAGLAADAGEAMPKEVTRKKGSLRMNNACALDVAQAAAELFAYNRTLGAAATDAITDADALMHGFALKLGQCQGIDSDGKADGEKDRWPDVRAALLTWTPPSLAK